MEISLFALPHQDGSHVGVSFHEPTAAAVQTRETAAPEPGQAGSESVEALVDGERISWAARPGDGVTRVIWSRDELRRVGSATRVTGRVGAEPWALSAEQQAALLELARQFDEELQLGPTP